LTWDKIRELHTQPNLPWAIIGDFNEILFNHEKEGVILERRAICKPLEMLYLIVA
jgi:hypothetical protein